ncbi:MAG: hypothetical protein V4665_04460 [Patescibacteria group bacterium]
MEKKLFSARGALRQYHRLKKGRFALGHYLYSFFRETTEFKDVIRPTRNFTQFAENTSRLWAKSMLSPDITIGITNIILQYAQGSQLGIAVSFTFSGKEPAEELKYRIEKGRPLEDIYIIVPNSVFYPGNERIEGMGIYSYSNLNVRIRKHIAYNLDNLEKVLSDKEYDNGIQEAVRGIGIELHDIITKTRQGEIDEFDKSIY